MIQTSEGNEEKKCQGERRLRQRGMQVRGKIGI